jgi:hypothetical protein
MKLNRRHTSLVVLALLLCLTFWLLHSRRPAPSMVSLESTLEAAGTATLIEKPLLPCTPQDYAQRLNLLMAEATLPYRLPEKTMVLQGDLHDSMTLQLDNDNTLIVLVDKASQRVASITLIINGGPSADSDASVLLTTAAVAAAAIPGSSLNTLTPVVAKLVSSYQNGADHAEQVIDKLLLRYDRVPSQAGVWFWIEPVTS